MYIILYTLLRGLSVEISRSHVLKGTYIKMPKPFSDDLRWRIICQRLLYAKRYNDVASQLFVSARTVLRRV